MKRRTVDKGVLQGEVLNPLLFSIILFDLEQHVRNDGIDGISLSSSVDLLLLMFVNDIFVLTHSPMILQRTSLERYCNSNKLTINTVKTNVLRFKRRNSTTELDPSKLSAATSTSESPWPAPPLVCPSAPTRGWTPGKPRQNYAMP